jgi:hypothetical protein
MKKMGDDEFRVDGARARHVPSSIEVWLDPSEIGYHHRRVFGSLGRPADGAFEVQVEWTCPVFVERFGVGITVVERLA